MWVINGQGLSYSFSKEYGLFIINIHYESVFFLKRGACVGNTEAESL